MSTFVLQLSRIPSDASWSLSCSIMGETKGFNSLQRSFATESEMIEAMKQAGISVRRFESAVEHAQNNAESSFEVSQNEAQRLSILHTDTSE